MGFIKNLARQGKDKAVSRTIEVLGEPIISKYGRLINLNIDSQARRIELEILLKGEPDPVSIMIDRYEITIEGEKSFITCRDINVSKEWMKILAEDLLKERKFEVPSRFAKLLEIIT